MSFSQRMTVSSVATLAGLSLHFLYCWVTGSAFLTDAIAEWIMAHTPSSLAVSLLTTLGAWAKPFAATGALATLGFAVFLLSNLRRPVWTVAAATMMGVTVAFFFGYRSLGGSFAFWTPALAVAILGPRMWVSRKRYPKSPAPGAAISRRGLLATAGRLALPTVMGAGTAGVAIESHLRNSALASRAVEPIQLFPYKPPADTFSEGLVRKPVTPVAEFYGMSKNTVDPVIDPAEWTLRITIDGRPWRELRYEELLSLPRRDQYVSLRCVSNTLRSNLMGTALWSGLSPGQLVNRSSLPPSVVEVAVIGADGHGDSFRPDYFFSESVLLAIGMNGRTLDGTHGFPIRLIVPRYYGFKHVKWIREIAFRSQPYIGTWPKMGYTKEPVIHTVSFIDRITPQGDRFRLGGIALSGHGGIRQVQIRAGEGEWIDAELEPPLSAYTWTRWKGAVPDADAKVFQARAMDVTGQWQADEEGPLFPNGVKGPTIRKL